MVTTGVSDEAGPDLDTAGGRRIPGGTTGSSTSGKSNAETDRQTGNRASEAQKAGKILRCETRERETKLLKDPGADTGAKKG